MSNVRHRIGLGTRKSLTGKNDITAKPPIRVNTIITADSTIFKADTTTKKADGQFAFTADSLRFSADSTLI